MLVGSSCLHSWTADLIGESLPSHSSTVVREPDGQLVLAKLCAHGIVRAGNAGPSGGGKAIPEYHLIPLSGKTLTVSSTAGSGRFHIPTPGDSIASPRRYPRKDSYTDREQRPEFQELEFSFCFLLLFILAGLGPLPSHSNTLGGHLHSSHGAGC